MSTMMSVIIVVLLAVLNASIGLLAILRNRRTALHRSLLYFTFVTSLWMVANFVGSNFKTFSLAYYFAHLDFLVGPFISYTLWNMTRAFRLQSIPQDEKKLQRVSVVLLLVAISVSLSSFTASLVTVHRTSLGITFEYGSLFELYGPVLIIPTLMGVYSLFVSYKKTKSELLRKQSKNMMYAIALFIVSLAIPNLILPVLSSSKNINLIGGNLAYLGILVFVGVVFNLIVRFKLLDIRLALTRTVGYLVAVMLAGLAYVLLVLLGSFFAMRLNDTFRVDIDTISIIIVPTLFIAATFDFVRRFILYYTNRIFYQSRYDLDNVLDELSSKIINATQIQHVLDASVSILGQALKPSYFYVVVHKSSDVHDNVAITAGSLPFGLNDFLVSQTFNELTRENVLVTDDLMYEQRENLSQNEVEAVVRMKSVDKERAVMLIGPKLNGKGFTKDDRRLLSVAAKNITIGLENAIKFEQIAGFTNTLKLEVKSATESLRGANQKLVSLDKNKDEMMSMASHQLRPQLTAVRGFLDLLKDENIQQERDELTQLSISGIERMIRVVTDMLNLTRQSSGNLTIVKSKTNFSNLITREILSQKPFIESAGYTVKSVIPTHRILLEIDVVMIREVLANFIHNAVQYGSKERPEILVTIEKTEKHVRVSVRDYGLGVPQKERVNIFKKFYRATNAREVRPAGSGVGIFLAKKVIDLHGGRVFYEPGQPGSIFGFELPLTSENKS